jgi:hypothetical protein
VLAKLHANERCFVKQKLIERHNSHCFWETFNISNLSLGIPNLLLWDLACQFIVVKLTNEYSLQEINRACRLHLIHKLALVHTFASVVQFTIDIRTIFHMIHVLLRLSLFEYISFVIESTRDYICILNISTLISFVRSFQSTFVLIVRFVCLTTFHYYYLYL